MLNFVWEDCIKWINIKYYIKNKIIIPSKRLIKCWALKVIGEPDIIPLSFKNAIIEPEKVIAPIAAPRDISIKLASFIFPTIPSAKASGFKNVIIKPIITERGPVAWSVQAD